MNAPTEVMHSIGPLDINPTERFAIADGVAKWTCDECGNPYQWNGRVYARGRSPVGCSTLYVVQGTCNPCLRDTDGECRVTDEDLAHAAYLKSFTNL